ncbi:hypothetical protein GQ42DRAFT_156520 [Ramicandelaber brevisporus]|nr:hypothetical protein GQ42DRAFT_156520 [Ramicandelaber brevisporus]
MSLAVVEMSLVRAILVVLCVLCTFLAQAATQTVVDVLSQDPEFAAFIIHLQHARLIPSLNRLRNVTVFAPTNAAIREWQAERNAQSIGAEWIPRDLLMNHVGVNEVLALDELHSGKIIDSWAVRYDAKSASLKEGDDDQTGVVQRIKVKLNKVSNGDEGEEVDQITLDSGARVIAGDYKGTLCVIHKIDALVKPLPSIAQVLGMDSSVNTNSDGDGSGDGDGDGDGDGEDDVYAEARKFIRGSEELSRLVHSHSDGDLTFFVPQNGSFASAFLDVEQQYLLSEKSSNKDTLGAEDDLHRLIHSHFVNFGPAVFVDRVGQDGSKDVTSMEGRSLTVTVGSDVNDVKLHTNGDELSTRVVTRDIVCSNGVIQLVDSVLPPRSLVFTTAKYLIGRNATEYVRMMQEFGLRSVYLDDSKHNDTRSDDEADNVPRFTLLAPTNAAISRWVNEQPASRSEVRDFLLYHVVRGKYLHSDLRDGQTLLTELFSEYEAVHHSKSDHLRHRVRVDVDIESESIARELNSMRDAVYFNGAPSQSHIGDYTKHTSFFLLENAYLAPQPLINTLIQDLRTTRYISYLYTSGIATEVQNSRAATHFVPLDSAFDSAQMLMGYLTLPESTPRSLLADLYRTHVGISIDSDHVIAGGMAYTSDLTDIGDKMVIKTLASKNDPSKFTGVEMERTASGVQISAGNSAAAKVAVHDVASTVGVIHLVDKVLVPSSIAANITTHNLARGLRTSSRFLSYAADYGLEDRLIDPVDRSKSNATGYAVFVPTDRAFARLLSVLDPSPVAQSSLSVAPYPGVPPPVNMTKALERIMQLHIVPIRPVNHTPATLEDESEGSVPEWPKLVDDNAYPTLLNDTSLLVREVDEGRYVVQVRDSSMTWSGSTATVTRIGTASNGIVYEIDWVLVPDDIDGSGKGGWWAWLLAGGGILGSLATVAAASSGTPFFGVASTTNAASATTTTEADASSEQAGTAILVAGDGEIDAITVSIDAGSSTNADEDSSESQPLLSQQPNSTNSSNGPTE